MDESRSHRPPGKDAGHGSDSHTQIQKMLLLWLAASTSLGVVQAQRISGDPDTSFIPVNQITLTD